MKGLWLVCGLVTQLNALEQTPVPGHRAVDSLVAALQRGGYVLVFRHAHTDRSKMDDRDWSLADRSTQRNLSERGADEASRIGQAMLSLGIPVGEVLTSPMFRTRETAEHAFGRGDTTELLRSRGSADKARALLTVPPASGTNRVLVTHNAYIGRYLSALGHGQIGEGDVVVVRPLGEGRFEVVGRIQVDDWRVLTVGAGHSDQDRSRQAPRPGDASGGNGKSAQSAPQESLRLVLSAGPDVLITRGKPRAQVEFDVASRPGSSRRLIVGGMGLDHPDGGATCNLYRSADGGSSWEQAVIPVLDRAGGFDPIVGYSPSGTAFFVCLARLLDEAGRGRMPIVVFRSEDDGEKWTHVFTSRTSEDGPVLGFDRTAGEFAGRAYLATLSGGADYLVRVFRSSDDGRSWVGPAVAVSGSPGRGVQPQAAGVLSDGAVFIPFMDFPLGTAADSASARAWLATTVSADGGVTFSHPVRGPTIRGRLDREDSLARMGGTRPQVLIDPTGRHRDRVYAIWTRYEAGHLRVMISVTTDRGRSWTTPRVIDPAAPAHAQQFNPHIAVSPSGILGVGWLDTRATRDGAGYHEYFAASADGGETFTAPLRVSTALSIPLGGGNLLPSPVTFRGPRGERRMALLPALARFPQGGDYLGMAADAGGVFHPVWPDARGGTFQAYTAAVKVDTAATARDRSSAGPPTDVTARIDVLLDGTEVDAATGEVRLLIRLRNAGSQTIRGPLIVEVHGFGSGMGTDFQRFAPEILNAENQRGGVGARFDYTDALGSGRTLPAGGVSGARLWRLRVPDFRRLPDLHLYVTGVIDAG